MNKKLVLAFVTTIVAVPLLALTLKADPAEPTGNQDAGPAFGGPADVAFAKKVWTANGQRPFQRRCPFAPRLPALMDSQPSQLQARYRNARLRGIRERTERTGGILAHPSVVKRFKETAP